MVARQLRKIPALLVCAALVLTLCAAGSATARHVRAYFPLDSGTMAEGAGGELVRVFDAAELVPGTRVLAGTSDSARLAAEQRAWLAAGRVPEVPRLRDSTMVRDALLDLYVLSRPYGVAVAGWAPAWRYVWPRDSALVAVALARSGHLTDAERVIGFLAEAQPESGVFEARYRPDGSGVPDGRGAQVDGVGWAVWAMAQVAGEVPTPERRAFVQRHHRLLERSSDAALALVDNPRSLPGASPDYWEREESDLTLSTAALVGAGLVAARGLHLVVGDEHRAAATQAAGQRVGAAIEEAFAAQGYPRTIGGTPASVDLGVSYLLPPYAEEADDEVLRVWRGAAAKMARPAGGLAPGGSWRDDGVSWNTATSSYAMTAAFVDRPAAVGWLQWLDRHRTALGSLPEKVLYDGEPASVAPLAWPAAAVVIAADELQGANG